MTNPIVHVEWSTNTPDDWKTFLTEWLGWQFQSFAPNYWMAFPSEGGVSVGLFHNEQAQAGGSPNVSVRVDDINEMVTKATRLGGSVAVPVTSMGPMGSFAFVKTPDGNLIGLQQIS
jgi:predicted enzyme related to lactoylglutathione lyase